MLNFLNEHSLLNNIRVAAIEKLEEEYGVDSIIIKNTRKIFDILIDDVFTETGDYSTSDVCLPINIIKCYFDDYMLEVKSDGFYSLYYNHFSHDMVDEQNGRMMEFDGFVEILRKRGLAYPKECPYKDAKLYILDLE